MQSDIKVNQIREKDNTYYKVLKLGKSTITCNTRHGTTGRYRTSSINVPLSEFKYFNLIKNPEDSQDDKEESKDEQNKNGKENQVDWSKTTVDSEKFKILKTENEKLRQKLLSRVTGEDLIIETVKDVISDTPLISIPYVKPQSKNGKEEIAILHISDTQIGKITTSYSSAVAELRLLDLIDKTILITDMRRSAATINEIRVYLGGDIIEGEDIFPHQAHEIDSNVAEQAIEIAPRILTQCIYKLLLNFNKVKVVGVPGNHGRNGPRHTSASPKTNWDLVCYSTINDRVHRFDFEGVELLEERLEFINNKDWYYVDHVFDWGNLVVHGDQITGGFAGFPWYGAAKKAWGWIDSIPQPWDYMLIGHFHTFMSVVLNHRIVLANGTTESHNAYAQSQLAASGYPCQRLAFFDAEHGLISDNPIYLTTDRIPTKMQAIRWLKQ